MNIPSTQPIAEKIQSSNIEGLTLKLIPQTFFLVTGIIMIVKLLASRSQLLSTGRLQGAWVANLFRFSIWDGGKKCFN